MKKEQLKELRNELLEYLEDYSQDFISEYSIDYNGSNYISDIITEFADNCVSVYCGERIEFYNKNPEICERAFLELYSPDYIAQLLKDNGFDALYEEAGVCGWFASVDKAIYNDLDDICKILAIDYVLNNFNKFNKKDFEEFKNNIDFIDSNRVNRFNDIIDCIQ